MAAEKRVRADYLIIPKHLTCEQFSYFLNKAFGPNIRMHPTCIKFLTSLKMGHYMDLQQKINQMFQGHAEILSLSTQKSYWRKTQGAWLNSSFNEFQRSFTPTAQKEIEEIKKGLSRNDPHAYIITLDHNDSELWITTINCTFADVKYMRSGKSAIKPKILSANGIYLASDNILTLNHRA